MRRRLSWIVFAVVGVLLIACSALTVRSFRAVITSNTASNRRA
ncbi:MAG TPA: hypothetical protein VKU62_08555 [Thermoanaerobaculia bacterium]|nr:hypothetical protein [Thermoanaerobaculia bacterium]